ncbi:hypothetical protein [Leptothoe spongobia]|uniref:Uncharacterized protein n=1 Tax=Leptothoe spongobia TAU-MAC 1115 TaxID=1967444 RepID=A0A947DGQ2_9CYAN|nr:hypothetical protein [Leptothoe spongobia]MBT9316263.1 hypothetical protein [Leptothoe spongobia TAU-MAC 1115]
MAKRSEVSEGYKERLAQWVEEELAKPEIESQRHFGSVVGVSYTTVQKWLKKLISSPLQDDSINKIARYRGWSSAKVRAWLHAVDIDFESDADEIVSLRIEVLEEKVLELQATMATLLEGPMLWVGMCIQDSLREAGIDWRTEEGIATVMSYLEKYDRGQWTRVMVLPILRGVMMPSEEQIHPLGFALNQITGEWPNGRMESEVAKTKESLKRMEQGSEPEEAEESEAANE